MDKYTDNYYSQESENTSGNYESDSVEIELRKTIQRQKKTMFRLMEKINRLRITCVVLLLILVVESFLLWGNSGNDTVIPENTVNNAAGEDNTTINIPEENQSPEQTDTAASKVDEAKVESIITSMTLEQKVYQMIFTTPENLTGVPAVTVSGDTSKAAIEKYPVGGIIYSQKNIENKQQVTDMLAKLQTFTKTGLFLAIEENGNDAVLTNPEVASSGTQATSFDSTDEAGTAYNAISAELLNLGFNTNLAPYTEASSKSSEYLGSDVQTVSNMVKTSVESMSRSNLASTLKYFPISESTSKTASDMKNSEFLPFKAGIDAGADFVIVSGKASGEGEPFSMSETYMNKALKTDLAFGGVVVADDITSSDISDTYTQEKAAVKAVNAGADMLICPTGVAKTVNAILAAVESGEISEKTIDDSVKRIIRVKLFRGIQN
ncbi:MAG: hypothetical protein IJ460_03920 [Clostridia bacterium]|nr:hypothetical protein [Clostridia bacterium]